MSVRLLEGSMRRRRLVRVVRADIDGAARFHAAQLAKRRAGSPPRVVPTVPPTIDPVRLYRREKQASTRRNAGKAERLRAVVLAAVARQEAEDDARKKGGRPRRSMPNIRVGRNAPQAV